MRGNLAAAVTLLFLYRVTSAAIAGRSGKFRFHGIQFFRAEDVPGNPPSPEDVANTLGYNAETHTVKTNDGYFLGVHRIYNQTAMALIKRPEPIILQHGLTCSSGQWVVLEPRQSLATMLADAGYDVWLTNIRGNMYSRKHETLSPSSAEFWDYGWHEHGVIDMPTMIDYVLNQTGYRQLWYAGHSMGTTMFFVMGSMIPEYNNKIRHMFALSPVAYMGKLKSPLRNLTPSVRIIQEIVRTTMNNHLPAETILVQLGKFGLCSVANQQCGQMLDSITGYNSRSNATVQEAFFRYFPDAASLKQASHYAQGVNNPGTFRLYDYYENNMGRYKAPIPPAYPVEKITAPMTFFYSTNDYLSHYEDVENFSKRLKNVKLYPVADKEFNHMDFIIATYAHELIYSPMIEMMNGAARMEK